MKRRLRAALKLNDLAHRVFRRLRGATAVSTDPHGGLDLAALKIGNRWLRSCRLHLDRQPRASGHAARCTPDPQRVQALFDSLPRHQREILLLHVKEGVPYQQIAQRTGMAEENTLQELVRAYSQLRLRLADEADEGFDRH